MKRTIGLLIVATLLSAQPSVAQTNIAQHRPISAGGSVAGQPALFANDGDNATVWNSGQTTGSITVDLGSPSTVSTVRLLVEQSPAGVTYHTVSTSGPNQSFSNVHTFNQNTQSNTWLTHTFSPVLTGVRYVQINTTSSPSWVAWREIEVLGQTAEPADCHACYFGYYWGAGEHPGMTGNYMSEFSGHSNIVHIVDGDLTRLASKLAEAHQRGMMAILAPQGHLFASKGTLRADYQAQWTAYANAVDPYVDDVLAIYPVDEPLWWGGTCHHDAATRQVYQTANAAIAARFPDKPIIATFAYPCVTANLTIPAGYDWISFDQYGTFTTIPGYFDIIKSKLSGNQKIILTADGFVAGGVPSVEAQYDWVHRARQYRTLALTNTEVIGLWTFIWPSFAEGAGVRDLPPLRDEYLWIGQQMSSCNPPGAKVCCVRNHCEDNNSNTRDSCNVLTRQCINTPINADAGLPPEDAGLPPEDAGLPPEDAGLPPEDAGLLPEDVGIDDAAVPPEDASEPIRDTGTPDGFISNEDSGIALPDGATDSGASEQGTTKTTEGCSCSSEGTSTAWSALLFRGLRTSTSHRTARTRITRRQ